MNRSSNPRNNASPKLDYPSAGRSGANNLPGLAGDCLPSSLRKDSHRLFLSLCPRGTPLGRRLHSHPADGYAGEDFSGPSPSAGLLLSSGEILFGKLSSGRFGFPARNRLQPKLWHHERFSRYLGHWKPSSLSIQPDGSFTPQFSLGQGFFQDRTGTPEGGFGKKAGEDFRWKVKGSDPSF